MNPAVDVREDDMGSWSWWCNDCGRGAVGFECWEDARHDSRQHGCEQAA